jgi:Acyl-CoA carboxylase epsilon subunit
MPSGLECIASSASGSASRRAEILVSEGSASGAPEQSARAESAAPPVPSEPSVPSELVSGPALSVVSGEPTAAELAAVVVVLAGLAAQASRAQPAARPRSQWAATARQLRPQLIAGPGAWKASALPR